MDFLLPVWFSSVLLFSVGLLDLENVGLAVEISFLSHLQAEIKVFPVWRPPSWIFHFRFGCNIFSSVPLDSLTSKIKLYLWNFFDIMSTSRDISTSGLEAAILDFPFPVGSTVF